jgi:hypothetical protein
MPSAAELPPQRPQPPRRSRRAANALMLPQPHLGRNCPCLIQIKIIFFEHLEAALLVLS